MILEASTTIYRNDFQTVPAYWRNKNIDLKQHLRKLGYKYIYVHCDTKQGTKVVKL